MKLFFPSDKLILALFIFLSLSGCSQKIQSVQETFKLALFPPSDVTRSKEEVDALPYASLYAKVGQHPRAFLVLAFAEEVNIDGAQLVDKHLLKWLSANNEMLVSLNGRIIKTLNINTGDLDSIYANEVDPLLLGLHKKSTPKKWQRTINHASDSMYALSISSSFYPKGLQVININGDNKNALLFEEWVSVDESAVDHINYFWLEPQTGKVISSIQKLAPNTPFIETHLLKPFSNGV